MNIVSDDLVDFIANNEPEGKRSKLLPFKDEILKLKELGYAEKNILQFLKEKKGITVTRQTLNVFIRKCQVRSAPSSLPSPANKPSPSAAPTPATSKPDEKKKPHTFTLRKTPMEDLIG